MKAEQMATNLLFAPLPGAWDSLSLCKPGLLAGLFCTWPVLSPGDAAPGCERGCDFGAAHSSRHDTGAAGAAAVSALVTVAKPLVASIFPALPFTPSCVSMHFPGFFFIFI